MGVRRGAGGKGGVGVINPTFQCGTVCSAMRRQGGNSKVVVCGGAGNAAGVAQCRRGEGRVKYKINDRQRGVCGKEGGRSNQVCLNRYQKNQRRYPTCSVHQTTHQNCNMTNDENECRSWSAVKRVKRTQYMNNIEASGKAGGEKCKLKVSNVHNICWSTVPVGTRTESNGVCRQPRPVGKGKRCVRGKMPAPARASNAAQAQNAARNGNITVHRETPPEELGNPKARGEKKLTTRTAALVEASE